MSCTRKSSSSSADPFNSLHSDVFDLVFQHFSSNELLTISTVNSLWYKLIGVSPNCMTKLHIVIPRSSRLTNSDNLELTKLQSKLNSLVSIRQYRNIYADLDSQDTSKILEILSAWERKWKSVELLNENFNNGMFFEHFYETVERLILTRINCDEESSSNFSFPRLKSLKVSSCNEASLKTLGTCSTLTALHLQTTSDSILIQECLAILLANNKNLQALTMLTSLPLLTEKIIVQCQIQLKKLVIDSSNEYSDNDRECLEQFLKNQCGSLESVDIIPWSGPKVVEQCFRMKNLKDFACKLEDPDIESFNLTLNINTSIERLHLRNLTPRDSLNLNKVLSNVPNLKVYKAESMMFDHLTLLSMKCKKLEELYIEKFDVEVLPNENCFLNLKKFKSWEVNDELLKSLKAKGAKNIFEKFILNY